MLAAWRPMFGPEVVAALQSSVVGRRREVELLLAALSAGAHVVLEGPPGTGKSTLLRSLAGAAAVPFTFVEGNAELTPARLAGSFDPARVLAEGYTPDVFVDGPLVEAMRAGGLLYVEEINRIPEETLNLLITVMSEGELHVPRLGAVAAGAGFRLVAAMNPFDAVGTARISAAIYDRVCRLTMDYQDAAAEAAIAARSAPPVDAEWLDRVVDLVRRTRAHADVRIGSSVRGSIDLVRLASSLAVMRGVGVDDWHAGRDAAMVALSGRMRLHDGGGRTPEAIVEELWEAVFGPDPAARDPDDGDDGGPPTPPPPPGGGARPPRPNPTSRPGPPGTTEGEAAEQQLAEEGRGGTSRGEMTRMPHFAEVSPSAGRLDEEAFEAALADDPDEVLALLAAMVGATDRALRERARRLAGRITLDRARIGTSRRRGVARLRLVKGDEAGADLDVDRSLDSIVLARAVGAEPHLSDLTATAWGRPATALCLAVDRSGSMAGARLATAALAAAACAWRAPDDHAVLAFADSVLAVRSMDRYRPPEAVAVDVLGLKGKGTTDLARALRASAAQLARSSAGRRVAIVLSDCRANDGADPDDAAIALDELCVVAPRDDAVEATAFARRTGARLALVDGPSSVPRAISDLLA